MAAAEKCENVPIESVENVEVVSKPQDQAEVHIGGGRNAESGDDHDVQRATGSMSSILRSYIPAVPAFEEYISPEILQGFLMIDRGEDIIKQLETVSRQYKEQVGILSQEVDHIWKVLRSFMLLFGPLLIGIVLVVMAKCTLPRGYHQNVITSLFVGVFTALVAFQYPPFHSAVEKYLSFRDSKEASEIVGFAPVSSDSETSTDLEFSEEKEEAKTNAESEGQPKKSEHFDMLPEPVAL